MWKIKFSELSDGVPADIDMRSALTLGQASHSVRLGLETVEPLGGVEIEILLSHQVRQVEECLNFGHLSPGCLDQPVTIDNVNLVPGEELVPPL